MLVQDYQKKCFRDYKASINLPNDYNFLYGNPVNVLVPIETALEGFMIVGAYPSAKLYTINGITDVPICDNDAPFSSESYFDGSRVRAIPSGKELEQNYLGLFGIDRAQCWITDLVKVFLFKAGHIERYRKLGNTTAQETRSRFVEFAKASLPWLEQEIVLAKPKIVFLLGIEVTLILLGVSEAKAKSLLNGILGTSMIGSVNYNVICLPHPGILMKDYPTNPWPKRFKDEIVPTVLEELKRLGLSK